VREVLPAVDILVLNAVEAQQLARAGATAGAAAAVLTTLGAEGAMWRQGAEELRLAGHPVAAVDTTAAGDTYLGYFAAGLDRGLPVAQAMRLAGGAAALKVTRAGTAAAIPALDEVEAFLRG
jgi:ribokinase